MGAQIGTTENEGQFCETAPGTAAPLHTPSLQTKSTSGRIDTTHYSEEANQPAENQAADCNQSVVSAPGINSSSIPLVRERKLQAVYGDGYQRRIKQSPLVSGRSYQSGVSLCNQ